MLAKTLFAAIALALSASAQTSTTCNPLKKTCPPNPALGSQAVNCDFTKGPCSIFTATPGTQIAYKQPGLGALFQITKAGQGPTLISNKYIFFGRVDVEVRATHGQGVVTAIVLQSSDLDEVDWEWIGGDNTQVQTNYFGKGDTTTYDRGQFHTVRTPMDTFHTYSLVWTKTQLQWLIDGKVVRSLNYNDAKAGTRYPQTPSQIKIGTWVAGMPGNNAGTVQWAGGYTDFKKGPFKAYYRNVRITDYAGGNSPAQGNVKQYVYGDRSGSHQSIKVVRG